MKIKTAKQVVILSDHFYKAVQGIMWKAYIVPLVDKLFDHPDCQKKRSDCCRSFKILN